MNKNSLYDAASRIFLEQDYEFTRLNTYVKKEMSEEFPKIDFVELKVGSNNNYWIKLSSIIGNYCPRKTSRLRQHLKENRPRRWIIRNKLA